MQLDSLLNGPSDFLIARTPATQPQRGDAANLQNQFDGSCIFPGSFDPIHDAHTRMATIAASMSKQPLWFEISIENIEKPSLDEDTIKTRTAQDFGGHGLVLTKAATFEAKSLLFPKCTFVVGGDTIVRIDEDRFYKGTANKEASFFQLAAQGIEFLVFGRTVEGKFLDENVSLTSSLKTLCKFVPQSDFDLDISSTEIRSSRH